MPEIKNEESLRAWLETRPQEDAIVIAARAALRALPGMASLFRSDKIEAPYTLVLSVLRAIAVACAGSTAQQQLERAASSAATGAQSTASAAHSTRSTTAAANSAHAAAHYIGSAVRSIASVSASAEAAAQSAAYSASATKGSAALGGYAYTATWHDVERDAERLESGTERAEILASPLWPDGPPEGLAEDWPTLRGKLLEHDKSWQVWTNWYQDRLNGKPINEVLEIEKALIPDEDWEKGPAHVNAIIAELIEKHSKKAAGPSGTSEIDLDALLASRDLRAALADFELDDFAMLIRMVPFVNDIKDLDNPAQAQDRANMLSELANLLGDLGRDCQKQLSQNAPDYVRLAANRYQREAKQGVEKVRPGRLWDVGLELAGALKDIEVESSFPDHLFNRLDRAVSKHRDLMREYFAGALARLRPLDRIEPAEDATREDAVAALEQSVEGLDVEDWGDAPPPDPEIAAEMADRVEELRDILQRINRTTDPDRTKDLDQIFWRKAKAAMLTVMRYSLKVAQFAGWSVGTAAALQALFPAQFTTALQMIQKILTNVPWL